MANKKVFCRQTYTNLLYYCGPVDEQCFTGWPLIGQVHDNTGAEPAVSSTRLGSCLTAGS